jgi:hypothetical protein
MFSSVLADLVSVPLGETLKPTLTEAHYLRALNYGASRRYEEALKGYEDRRRARARASQEVSGEPQGHAGTKLSPVSTDTLISGSTVFRCRPHFFLASWRSLAYKGTRLLKFTKRG